MVPKVIPSGYEDGPVLDLDAISRLTGVPVNTLRYYRATGRGPRMFRLGGRVVALRRDVEAWIATARDAEGT
jgi:predicted DNA-binding transcriptional regulator AlpA